MCDSLRCVCCRCVPSAGACCRCEPPAGLYPAGMFSTGVGTVQEWQYCLGQPPGPAAATGGQRTAKFLLSSWGHTASPPPSPASLTLASSLVPYHRQADLTTAGQLYCSPASGWVVRGPPAGGWEAPPSDPSQNLRTSVNRLSTHIWLLYTSIGNMSPRKYIIEKVMQVVRLVAAEVLAGRPDRCATGPLDRCPLN